MRQFGGEHFRTSLRHFLLGRVTQALLSLTLTLLTIRLMSPMDYGVYLILIGITDLLRPLTSLGVLPTVQRFLPEMALHATEDQLLKFVKWARVVRWTLLFGLTLIVFASWQYFVSFSGIPNTTLTVCILVCLMAFCFLALEYSEATLEALLDQKASQLARVLHTFLRLSCVIGLSLLGRISVENLLLCEVLSSMAALIYSDTRLNKRIRNLKPDGSRAFSRSEIISYGLHLSYTQIIYSFATPGILRTLVARQLGVEAAGQFGFMQTLLLQISRLMPSLLLANLVNPMLIAAKTRGHSEKIGKVCGLLFKSNVLLVWPIFPIFLLAGDQLMAIVSGNRLVEQGVAMSWLVLGLSAMTQMQVATTVLQVHRMSGRLAWIGSLFVLVPAFVYVGASHSLVGSCLGFFVASAIRQGTAMWIIQKSAAKVHLDIAGSSRYFFALFFAFLIASSLLAQSVSVIVCCVVFVATFGASLPFIKPFSSSELSIIQEALNRKLPWLNRFSA